jgi:hypothetical protein
MPNMGSLGLKLHFALVSSNFFLAAAAVARDHPIIEERQNAVRVVLTKRRVAAEREKIR